MPSSRLEVKYFSYYKRLINKITFKTESTSYNELLTNHEIATEDEIANDKREKYFKHAHKETARGLPYQHNFYEFYNYPILFEEVWENESLSDESNLSICSEVPEDIFDEK